MTEINKYFILNSIIICSFQSEIKFPIYRKKNSYNKNSINQNIHYSYNGYYYLELQLFRLTYLQI